MRKEQLLGLAMTEIQRVSIWHDYNQFLCDEIEELLPFLSAEGLQYLIKQTKKIDENRLFSGD